MPNRFTIGTGIGQTFSGRITTGPGVPALLAPGSVVIRGGLDLIVYDDRNGHLIGAVATPESVAVQATPATFVSSVINYATGDFTIMFETVPASSEVVEAYYTAQTAATVLPDYTALSFDGLVALLTQFVRRRDSWKDVYDSNEGQMLIQLVAYVANGINYMIARRSQESYILTARLRSSMIRLANLLNYRIRRQTGARTTLRFTLTDTPADQLFIPRYTKVLSITGIPFLTLTDAYISPRRSETYVDVEAIQGEFVQDNYLLPDVLAPNYILPIGDTSIEDGTESLHVYTGLEDFTEDEIHHNLWTEVGSFFQSRSGDTHYVLLYGLHDEISLRFGDGFFGQEPPGVPAPTGKGLVRVEYIRTLGYLGNISSLNVITSLQSTVLGSTGQPFTGLTVANLTTASGGADVQSTEEIRELAPAVFRTGDRGVTREDIITTLKNYPGVLLANCWGEQENDPPNIIWFNRVEIAVVMNSKDNPDIPLDWANPSATQKTGLLNLIGGKRVLTTYTTIAEVGEVMLILAATVYALDNYSLLDVQRKVTTALQEMFTVGKIELGSSIYFSEIVDAIQQVAGVHHVDIAIAEPFASIDEAAGVVSAGGEVQGTLSRHPVAPGKVFFQYGNQVVVDHDNGDGTGVFLGAGDTVVDTAREDLINYTSGNYRFWVPADAGIDPDTPVVAFYKARLYHAPSPNPEVRSVVTDVDPSDGTILSGTLSQHPVRPGSLTFTLDGKTIADSSTGGLHGDLLNPDGVNTVDYDTGEFHLQLALAATGPTYTAGYNSYLSNGNLIVLRTELVTFDPLFKDNLLGINFEYAE